MLCQSSRHIQYQYQACNSQKYLRLNHSVSLVFNRLIVNIINKIDEDIKIIIYTFFKRKHFIEVIFPLQSKALTQSDVGVSSHFFILSSRHSAYRPVASAYRLAYLVYRVVTSAYRLAYLVYRVVTSAYRLAYLVYRVVTSSNGLDTSAYLFPPYSILYTTLSTVNANIFSKFLDVWNCYIWSLLYIKYQRKQDHKILKASKIKMGNIFRYLLI